MLMRLGCAFIVFATLQLPSQPPRATGLVVGQVVDAAGGRPVAGAVVGISGPPAPNGQPWPRVLTGSDGRFVFRDLRRGDYTITATKPGFAEGAYGRNRAGGPSIPLSLNEGERVGDAVVRLWRHAAISGTIVDESGERLVGVSVRAFRRTVIGGRRRFASSNSGTSDDRGMYRISGLLPGDYLVATVSRQVVVPLSLFRNLPPGAPERNIPVEMGLLAPGDTAGLAVMTSGDAGILLARGTPIPPPPVNGRLAVYPPTFHPSTTTGSASSVISLRPGEEHLDADLQLTPVPTVRVSGFIFGPDGPVGRTAVRLVPANTTEFFSEADLPSTTTDNGGAFVFPAVPSGHYSIRIAPRSFQSAAGGPSNLLWLDASLSAGTEDIDGVTLAALPGVRLSGRLQFEGASPPVQLSNVSVLIEPADVFTSTSAYYARTWCDR